MKFIIYKWIIVIILLLYLSLFVSSNVIKSKIYFNPPIPKVNYENEIVGLNIGETYRIFNGNSSICEFMINESIQKVPCNCFNFPSKNYHLYKVNKSLPLIKILSFEVEHQDIKIIIPSNAQLLEDMEVRFESKLCTKQVFTLSLEHRDFYFIPSNISNIDDDSDHWITVEERTIQLHTGRSKKKFFCQFISLEGFYRINLKSFDDMNNLIEIKSSIIPLSPVPNIYGLILNKPSINIRSDSIFPHCINYFTLSWERSSCPNLDLNFRVQVTGITDLRKTNDWIYIEELLLPPNKKTLDIECSLFDIIFEKYCFELVSTHRYTEKTQVWDKKCVKTEPLKRIDGGFGNWSEFSLCYLSTEGKCIQKRFRKCDNPKPSGGLDCQGSIMEIRDCESSKCSNKLIKSPLTLQSSNCSCGCNITNKSGSFFVGRGKYPFCEKKGKLEWTLKSPKETSLHKRFFDIKPFQKYYITIDKHFLNNENDVVQLFNDKNLIWESQQSTETEIVIYANTTITFIFKSKTNITQISGVIINYILKDNYYVMENITYSTAYSICIRNYCSRILFFTLCGFAISIILFLPTTVCFFITRLLKKDKWKKIQEEKDRKTKYKENSDSIRSEMIKSNNTNSTHIPDIQNSTNGQKKFVTCRSIGIQLSTQNTPSCSRSTRFQLSENSSSRNTPRAARSSLSFASINEMEYDYYEPIVPGSFLYPQQFDMASDIDIDSIIRQEAKSLLIDPPVDAHTQI
uniref:Protein kinase domain-containing protein n=1 Tax=Strongyloides stercoralis TaxID=6248 RepID=A0A0K0DV43_STRER